MNSPIKITARLLRQRAVIFLIISACTAPQIICAEQRGEIDLYQQLKVTEPLRKLHQFVVIDDFNSGKFSTHEKERWRAKTPRGGKAQISINSKDGRNPKRGHSLQAELRLLPNQTADLEKTLNFMDVSQATDLLFRYKVRLKQKLHISGKAVVLFTDRSLQKSEFDVSTQVNANSGQWQTLRIPMSFFKDLDLDQLSSFCLRIRSGKGRVEGTVSLDEIAFFGTGNLNFESSRDNITGFPGKVFDEERQRKLRGEKNDRKFLWIVAKDTWKFFENAVDKKTQLIVDNVKLGEQPVISGYTSPTNIAMNLLSIIAAMDLKIITSKEALHRTRAIISTLAQMKKHEGLFFNFYETKNLVVTRSYVSSVDNGWLGIALVIVRQAFPRELWSSASQILKGMNFSEFLDTENNQLIIGYDVPIKNFGGSHYGMLVSEARATSLLAIGKGDLHADHWWFLYRTPPEAWRWQSQVPKGTFKTQDGVEYFQGYYEKNKTAFVPSWGGSLFEFLMPTLVIDEKRLAPDSFGKNNEIVTRLHRDYALKEKGYPVWGISPAATENGKSWKYEELGVKDLGVKGYPDREVVTPHVSFLALDSLSAEAISNLRRYLDYSMYGEYGYFDSLSLKSGSPNTQYLSLDQGMILTAICNYLKDGAIQKRFEKDPVAENIKEILTKERFFS